MFDLEVNGRKRNVEVRGAEVMIDGRRMHVDAVMVGRTLSLIIGGHDIAGRDGSTGRCYEVSAADLPPADMAVQVNGRPVAVRLHAPGVRSAGSPSSGGATDGGAALQRVTAPMPGRIAKVLVQVGDAVTLRQGLVVVEAMKMENELRSPRAGKVVAVEVVEGQRVEANAVLVVVE